MTTSYPHIHWEHHGDHLQSLWYSEADLAPPKEIMVIDDTMAANKAIALARQGVGLLWSGDFQNGRELLRAMARRLEKPPRIGSQKTLDDPAEIFAFHRQQQGIKAQVMGSILIALTKDFVIELRRGQDVSKACFEVMGPLQESIVMPFKQLLAIVSAHEWRKKKVFIPAIEEHIIPHFGVFSPIRGEYLDIVKQAQLPKQHQIAFDIGTGTGVLAILLAKRGIPKVIGTDLDPRAIACAKENITALGFQSSIELIETHLFPLGRADLIVCNPPWLPATPSSHIEHAIYDPNSQFLKEFLNGLKLHLNAQGQAWLIISDLAEHLGLRTRPELLDWIASAGLTIAHQIHIKAKHPKTRDDSDPLYFARAKEITTLWVLEVA